MSDGERAASPERLSPTHAGMTGDNAVRRFTYLLNAMELAAQAENPAEQGYAAKRKSVCDFVWLIGESLGDAMGRAGAALPGAADQALREAANEVAHFAEDAGSWCESGVFPHGSAWHLTVDENNKLDRLTEALRAALSGGAADKEGE